jgi:bacteriorhodopsin
MTAIVDSGAPTIDDTTTYVLPLASLAIGWMKLYSFNSAYGLRAFDAPNLLTLQATIATNLQVRSHFFNYYNSARATATPSPLRWLWYWCGHTNLTSTPYAACLMQNNRASTRSRRN